MPNIELLDVKFRFEASMSKLKPDIYVVESKPCYRVYLEPSGDTMFPTKKSSIQGWNTLYSVSKFIVEWQTEFFKNGPEHIVPLRMKDVADNLGIDIATVSRTIKGQEFISKQERIPIKNLFNQKLANGDSGKKAMAKILRLVQSEDKNSPLRDFEIVDLLKNENIIISRRTVAKYRKEQGILICGKRKSQAKTSDFQKVS